jgi:hypothetical protein
MLAGDRSSSEHDQRTPDWHTFVQYIARNEKQGMGINLASSQVGATSVRRKVPGDNDVQPTLTQLDQRTALGPGRHAQRHTGPRHPMNLHDR